MKKKLLSLCASAILQLTIIHSSSAQNSDAADKPDLSFNEKSYATLRQKSKEENPVSLRLNERNSMAVQSFVRDFGDVADVRWIKSENGLYVAYYIHNDIRNWIVYNNKGTCESVIRSYYEEKLPRSVRHIVKSVYYDFSIYCINELTVSGITVYTVTLTDKTRDTIFWKVVQVAGGEMELINEYSQKAIQPD